MVPKGALWEPQKTVTVSLFILRQRLNSTTIPVLVINQKTRMNTLRVSFEVSNFTPVDRTKYREVKI